MSLIGKLMKYIISLRINKLSNIKIGVVGKVLFKFVYLSIRKQGFEYLTISLDLCIHAILIKFVSD